LKEFPTIEKATKSRKRTRLAPEQRREQLVLIGARLFAERPFSDVWIEEVADEAGVSRGLIYHYFPNKRDFYAEIVRFGIRGAYDLTKPDETLPPDQWLSDGIDRLLKYVETNANAFRAIYRGTHSVDDEIREVVREGRVRQTERMLLLISPDEPASETVRLAVEGWVSMLDALLLEWLDGREIERRKLVDLLAGSLMGAIVTAMSIDGHADRLEAMKHLAPAVFKPR
jgi:AcrR family transcriptional regulator